LSDKNHDEDGGKCQKAGDFPQALQNTNFFSSEGCIFYGIVMEYDLLGRERNGVAYGEQV
jgi:hypothetical protein